MAYSLHLDWTQHLKSVWYDNAVEKEVPVEPPKKVIDTSNLLMSPRHCGILPIMRASFEGINLLEHLCYLDIDDFKNKVNAKDSSGWTPLHFASYSNNLECIVLLVHYGAIVNEIDNGRWTPLHRAAQQGLFNMVKFLLQNGANHNLKNVKGYTPLCEAIECGSFECVEILLEHGADVNLGDLSPLLLACKEGYVRIAELLLNYGANPFIKIIKEEYSYAEAKMIDVEKTCVTIAKEEYRPYIRELICRRSIFTMNILILQDLFVYHHLDCDTIRDLWKLIEHDTCLLFDIFF